MRQTSLFRTSGSDGALPPVSDNDTYYWVKTTENLQELADSITELNLLHFNLTALLNLNTNSPQLLTVEAAITQLLALHTNLTDVLAVNANKLNIDLVAGSITNVNAVALDLANINIVATNIADVNIVALNIAAVTSAVTNLAAIIAAPTEASNAAISAAAALVSQNAAAASEAAAALSASNALTSETNALASQTAAGLSETASAASQTASALSETNAATSATNAATSATNALTSETNAANSYDLFDDRMLGAKTADPLTDNDSDPLLIGAIFWDTTISSWKVWDGSDWVATPVLAFDGIVNGGDAVTRIDTVQIRRDTAADWVAENPVLLEGEWAIETDTYSIKIGDGVTTWISLDYAHVKNKLYITNVFYPTRPNAGDLLLFDDFTVDVVFPLNLDGSTAKSKVAAVAATSLVIKKNEVAVGSVDFAADATVGTFTFATEVTYSINDTLEIYAPDPVDIALKQISITLKGLRV